MAFGLTTKLGILGIAAAVLLASVGALLILLS